MGLDGLGKDVQLWTYTDFLTVYFNVLDTGKTYEVRTAVQTLIQSMFHLSWFVTCPQKFDLRYRKIWYFNAFRSSLWPIRRIWRRIHRIPYGMRCKQSRGFRLSLGRLSKDSGFRFVIFFAIIGNVFNLLALPALCFLNIVRSDYPPTRLPVDATVDRQ